MTTATSENLGREIPRPSPGPVLGWLPWLLQFVFDPLSSLERLRKQYGDMIEFGLKKHSAVIVFAPELNRQILRDPSVFYSYNTELLPIPFPKDSAILRVTTGMPLMNGPRHADHRSALLPFFHKKMITRYHDNCIEVTERKIASWRVGMELNMRAEMEQLAMWLATEPVLGLDPQREGDVVGQQLERTMKLIMDPFVLMFPYDLPGFPFRKLMRNGEEMERIVKGVIARKKEEGLTGKDVLSIMIQMHEQGPDRLSERELIGHTTTMFRGGYNPSGMVLYWTLFLLSQHPQELKKVLAELDQLKEDAPSPEEVEHMPYLEGALKETMRLFPAGTWTARLSMQDFELASRAFPRRTWIVMSPYITHRIPEVFPDPYHFVPERWLSIHPSAYEFMPFSAGPRYCIGTSLAMMQLKIAMSILLKRFRYRLKPGTNLDCAGLNSIRPKNGLPMFLHGPDEECPPTPFDGNIKKLVAFS